MTKKTRPSNIKITEKAILTIEKHSYSNLKAEVGGMLFGHVSDDGKTEIIGSIPALTAAAEQISLTFTHEVWAEILKEGEEKFPGEKIVGWYHTHPSFGIFLSEYDLFIQNNFFGNKGQLALVVDPIAGEMGWFGKKQDSKVDLLFKEPTKIGPRSPEIANGIAKRAKSQLLYVAVGSAILTAAATWLLSTALTPNYQKYFASKQQDYLLLETQFDQLQTYFTEPNQANFYYIAQSGDTWASISQRFYGSTAKVAQLKEDNWKIVLKKGEQVFLRAPLPLTPVIQGIFPEPSPTPTPQSTQSVKPSASPSASATGKKK